MIERQSHGHNYGVIYFYGSCERWWTFRSNVIFVPHSPGNVSDLSSQIRETIFSAQKINEYEKGVK